MRVLVLGGGGREHALVWKLRQSPRVTEVFCAPGNAGIAREAACVPADLKNIDELVQLAHKIAPGLTIVGPELPLSLGVVDEFERRGLPIFGPSQKAARLESSKAFSKEFMQRANIPTAHYAICRNAAEVQDALALVGTPVVVKADGLAAGKGVVIAQSKDEAAYVASEMLSQKLVGEAGSRVVIEEFLHGEELSFLVVSDGNRIVPLVPSRDHKRIGDSDTGPNTGGMGAYSDDRLLDDSMREWLVHHIARPVVDAMRAEGTPYKGVLYIGLMMTARGPMVLEFNCRFGDPETQAVLFRLESDLVDVCESASQGALPEAPLRWSPDPSVCVVMAAAGYPHAVRTGQPIFGLDHVATMPNVKVFHAGTGLRGDQIVTAGGRVLGVTASGPNLAAAAARAYDAVAKIRFEGMQFRRDIARKAVEKKSKIIEHEGHEGAQRQS
ncbi:MAG TPA: phosphoribosylamine--glycine ligase [Terriglobales bacterium]|nr:phosphoribosylamine--glycine ligase [Terriglobales bacterium]